MSSGVGARPSRLVVAVLAFLALVLFFTGLAHQMLP